MAPRRLPPPDLSRISGQYVERSGGCHLSAVLHDLLATIDPKRFGDHEHAGPNWAKLSAGLIFERALELAWLDKECETRPNLIRIGEIQDRESGIVCTPDAIDMSSDQEAVEEFKATWMSSRDGVGGAKFWHYWEQSKFYCSVLGMRTVNLHIFFVNGNYDRDRNSQDPDARPHVESWTHTFTSEQLEDTRRMVIGHARKRGMI